MGRLTLVSEAFMITFDFAFFFNSGFSMYVMVRYARYFFSAAGWPMLAAYLFAALSINVWLMQDRYAFWEALLRAAGIAGTMAACAWVNAVHQKRRLRTKPDC